MTIASRRARPIRRLASGGPKETEDANGFIERRLRYFAQAEIRFAPFRRHDAVSLYSGKAAAAFPLNERADALLRRALCHFKIQNCRR